MDRESFHDYDDFFLKREKKRRRKRKCNCTSLGLGKKKAIFVDCDMTAVLTQQVWPCVVGHTIYPDQILSLVNRLSTWSYNFRTAGVYELETNNRQHYIALRVKCLLESVATLCNCATGHILSKSCDARPSGPMSGV